METGILGLPVRAVVPSDSRAGCADTPKNCLSDKLTIPLYVKIEKKLQTRSGQWFASLMESGSAKELNAQRVMCGLIIQGSDGIDHTLED